MTKRKILIDGQQYELDEDAARLVARLIRERDAARSGKRAQEREAAELRKLRTAIRNERLGLMARLRIWLKKHFGG